MDCMISIQHLFRFDVPNKNDILIELSFQYNTCFGSTSPTAPPKLTFHISIQHLFRFDLKLKGSATSSSIISIQHLFRFDSIFVPFFIKNPWFQYNTCFGSTYKISLFDHFYTHISIQHLFRFDKTIKRRYDHYRRISIQHLFRFDTDTTTYQ